MRRDVLLLRCKEVLLRSSDSLQSHFVALQSRLMSCCKRFLQFPRLRTNLTHQQRQQIAQQTDVTRLQRQQTMQQTDVTRLQRQETMQQTDVTRQQRSENIKQRPGGKIPTGLKCGQAGMHYITAAAKQQ
jgi:hypothetical protein